MKKNFTKKYIMTERWCYNREDVEKIKCINNKKITLNQLYRDLSIKDFTWFLIRKCDLTLIQKIKLALHCAKQVLPICDKRMRACIEATELYLENKITIDELEVRRHAAADEDAASYAASAVYYAADAAAEDADDEDAYRKSIWDFIKDFN